MKLALRNCLYLGLLVTVVLAAAVPKSTAALTCATPTTAASISQPYSSWKQLYVVGAGNAQLRVARSAGDNYDTVSEGIAYGMLFSVYSNDRATFDGLWHYAQSHTNQNGLMNWRIAADGSTTGYNGATDADEDMAAALVAADTQWGGYKPDAQKLINLIKNYEIEPGSNVLKPGDAWGGSSLMNPSYLTPSYYTVFAKYMNDSSWNDVRIASYKILNSIHDTTDSRLTGFIPDWSTAGGAPAPGMSHDYGYDGSRAPLRLALASAWDCDTNASSLLATLNSYNQTVDLHSLASSYHLDGSVNSPGDGTPLLAAAAAAATASDNANLRTASSTELANAKNAGYFSDSLRLFGLYITTGTFSNPLLLKSIAPEPAAQTPVAPKTYSLTGSNVTGDIGKPITANVNVTAPELTQAAIIDLEVYDANGTRVAQKFYDNQSVTTAATAYAISFTPSSSGTYTVRGGIFINNWAKNLAWNNNISTITINSPVIVTMPPAPAPVSIDVPSSPSAPAQQIQVPSNVSIWWPSNGQSVRGVQPFKAVLDGYALSDYTMYWQVDGGTLNSLGNSTVDAPHKESLVDVSGWNWRANQQYTITFVAKNASGTVIAQKSTTIIVAH